MCLAAVDIGMRRPHPNREMPLTATLSIVIPTLDAEKHLPRCLDSLIEGLTAGLIRDLVITDGGSTDATVEMAHDVGATLVSGPASRGAASQKRAPCLAWNSAAGTLP